MSERIVQVCLPEAKVQELLAAAIKGMTELSDLLEFNRSKNQWSIMRDNLAKIEGLKLIIMECNKALDDGKVR